MRKLFVTLFALAFALLGGIGVSYAQSHAGGGHGGWHGGGGAWHGGGGISHGGGAWHGGGWHGGHHGGHFHGSFGVVVGAPWYWWGWGPAYYPYPYYYPTYYPAYYDDAPTVYVEKDRGGTAEGQYSYYCTDPAGYYPQVANCNKEWLKVVPDGSRTPKPLPR